MVYDKIEENIWQVFKKNFSLNDRVIVVHSDCKLYTGRLTSFGLSELNVGSKTFNWSDVVLIAHDGFPCKAFHSTLSLEQFDKVDNWESMLSLYKYMDIPLEGLDEGKSFQVQANALRKMVVDKKAEVKKEERERENYKHIDHGGFGCPFEIIDVQATVLNPFNGLEFGYEETLLMKSNDGAIGMLWDLESEILEVNV